MTRSSCAVNYKNAGSYDLAFFQEVFLMPILKLAPACKDYLWGGIRLKEEYHKRFDGPRLAETWELSCHPDGLSLVAEGPMAGQTLARCLAEKTGGGPASSPC